MACIFSPSLLSTSSPQFINSSMCLCCFAHFPGLLHSPCISTEEAFSSLGFSSQRLNKPAFVLKFLAPYLRHGAIPCHEVPRGHFTVVHVDGCKFLYKSFAGGNASNLPLMFVFANSFSLVCLSSGGALS